MAITLTTPLLQLPTVGPRTAKLLAGLGLKTAQDIIFHFPFRYDDFSQVLKIKELKPNTVATIKATVEMIQNRRSPRKRMIITEALLRDDSGSIKAVWFRQPFLVKTIKPGDELYLSGKAEGGFLNLQFNSPAYEKAKMFTLHTARLVPVYPATNGLTQKQIRYLIKLSLSALFEITETLPKPIIIRQKLIDLPAALKQIHFPQNEKAMQQARERLKFDELFIIQLGVLKLKAKLAKEKAPKINFFEQPTKNFVKSLPFELTQSQRKASWEILKDLDKPSPMNRLLEGDVGSGKTVVAGLAILNVSLNRRQTAFMAPTEILAKQHFSTLSGLFKKEKIKLGLLTNSYSRIKDYKTVKDTTKQELRDKIQKGKIDVVIGTHAIIQKQVSFNNLALAVIDEQHRFGVEQRKTLKGKTNDSQPSALHPHLLSMTATPIPRSLALTIYGDLDLSVLNQMPTGRKKILTKIVSPENRKKAYDFIRLKIKEGRQAFVICPLIEESDKLGIKAAVKEYEKLKNKIFPDLAIGLLHGRMKSAEKEKTMQEFSENKINILVSTAVVEVGVDIPNAAIMMIEGAERFGLAQLHQFRGRVGRSEHQSYCLLFTEMQDEKTDQRLNALVKSHNGFALAEKDLALRGPGEVYGNRQSGYFIDLKIARLTDYDLIKRSRQESLLLLSEDPELDKYPELKKKTAILADFTHLE